MINLMPTGLKQDIFYARRNTALRKWLAGLLIALSGVAIIVAFGLLYMQQAVNKQQKQETEARQALQIQKLEETQKRVDEVSSNTKLAVQVLSREILFSKLIRQIGANLPNDSILTELEIDNSQSGISLFARAGNYSSATQVQINLLDPKNAVFEKADIDAIDCGVGQGSTDPLEQRYPCDISLKALFGKNNSFRYITPTSNGGNAP